LRIEAAELAPEISLLELSAGAFDLVIAEQYPGHTRPRRDGVTHAILGQDWLRLVVPKDFAADGLSELADQPWVLEPEGTAVRQWAVQQCRAAGFEPQVRFNAADLATHVRLIAAGHDVGMLPDLVWAAGDPARDSVRQLPLPSNPSREILVAFRTAAAADGRLALVRQALRDAFAERSGTAGGLLAISAISTE
jgi:DNA-binding transcriptional LysR family regulator